jgi:hypothetical protein
LSDGMFCAIFCNEFGVRCFFFEKHNFGLRHL